MWPSGCSTRRWCTRALNLLVSQLLVLLKSTDLPLTINSASQTRAQIASAVLEEADMAAVVQTLITKCMESDDLCNEFYLQLIKQTTDCFTGTFTTVQTRYIYKCHSECMTLNMNTTKLPFAESNLPRVKYWHLLLCICCVMLPPNNLILSYLNLHLKRHSLMCYNEEGKFAQFCIKVISSAEVTAQTISFPTLRENNCAAGCA